MGVRGCAGGLLFALFLGVATAAGGAAAVTQPTTVLEPTADTVPAPVLAAAGDIACDPKSASFNAGVGTAKACHQQFTSDLLQDPTITAVATLGDNAYLCGSSGSYAGSYDPTWGRSFGITNPSTGNHDYYVNGPAASSTGCDATNKGAHGYFTYFGSKAGDPGKGWYSYDLGAWHVVVLNSNCSAGLVGGCGPTSEQYQWLKSDLEDPAHATTCTLAYWHHPLYSGGDTSVTDNGGDTPAADLRNFWNLLYQNHADLVLNGHRHWYERFMPLTPNAEVDPANGIREFIVGTGGEDHQGDATRGPLGESYDNKTFGILRLTLHDSSYDWKFVPEAGAPLTNGQPFTDTGSGQCHQPSDDVTAPGSVIDLDASVPDNGTQVDLSWTAPTDDVGVVGYEILRNGTPVSYTTDTTFTDTDVVAGRSYTYTVKAYDQAGNEASPSNPASVTVPGGTETLQLTAVADGRTHKGKPNAGFGTVSPLMVDGTPQMRSYLRFDLSELAGRTLVSAKLRLWVTNASPVGGSVVQTNGGAWSETALTWNNQPGLLSSPTATIGSVTAGSSKQVDVTSLVNNDGSLGSFDIAVTSSNADNAAYLSRESTNVARRPTLVVTVR